MCFPLDESASLVVEYDGAYWHANDHDRDRRKNDYLMQTFHGLVIRIREHPLKPLSHQDVTAPPRSDPYLCVRLALLHLLHQAPYISLRGQWLCDTYDGPVVRFLRLDERPISWKQVRCIACRRMAVKTLPANALREFHTRNVGQPFWRQAMATAAQSAA